MKHRRTLEQLSEARKVALVALLKGHAVIRRSGAAILPDGTPIQMNVIYSLYDRYLVAIRIEAGARRYKYALLTEIGAHAARSIQQEAADADNFEDATEAYGITPDVEVALP